MTSATITLRVLFLAWLCASPTACFQVALLNARRSAGACNRTALSANPNTLVTPDSIDRHGGMSPNQIRALRKEASHRAARNVLVEHTYDQDDLTTTLGEALQEHELIQVRGLARDDDKKMVAPLAQRLASDLSVELQRAVTIVQIQGHAVTLYSPSSNIQKRKILLRTSFQEGQLSYRQKAPRDHRGQIIKE